MKKVYFYIMFEWDDKKLAQNLSKHGVSFEDALEIWQSYHITAKDVAYIKDGEVRNATIGFIKGNLYTAIWTI
jgi:uncharacterized DUF497 family protein